MSNPRATDLLAPYCAVSDARGVYDLLSRYLGIFAVAWLAHTWGNWFGYLLAVIVIGTIQHALINLQHEAFHYLCFRSRRVNDFIASWFYSYAIGIPYYFNQTKHRGHHAYFGTEKDPDRETYINAGKFPGSGCVLYLTKVLLGGSLWGLLTRFKTRKDAKLPGMDLYNPKAPSTRVEYLYVMLSQIPLFLIFWLIGGWWYYFLVWLLPVVTVFMFLATLRNFIEHANPEDDVTPEERLFDFQPTPVESFFLAPVNFQMHAFHHAFPKIPHYRIKQARQAVRDNGIAYPGREVGGYLAVLWNHIRSLDERNRNNSPQPVVEPLP